MRVRGLCPRTFRATSAVPKPARKRSFRAALVADDVVRLRHRLDGVLRLLDRRLRDRHGDGIVLSVRDLGFDPAFLVQATGPQ